MIRKYHNHKPQTTPWHREEEPLNHHETPQKTAANIFQSNRYDLFSKKHSTVKYSPPFETITALFTSTSLSPAGVEIFEFARCTKTHLECFSLIVAPTRENLSSWVCEQQRRRPACASAQTDQRLCYSLIGKYHILTCYKRNFNFLDSLCR